MSRHTTFRYRLDLTVEQRTVLARHAGAARFAFNQCLHMVKTALAHRTTNPGHPVPWTRFSLINEFNTWKKTEAAGRVFAVSPGGVAEVEVTGLEWRTEVCQQVFEEAAVDCGRALAAWSESRKGKRKGQRVGFPRFKKKNRGTPAFRLRNKRTKSGQSTIRVGDAGVARSVTLPGLGALRVCENTRSLRRMLTGGRAKILYATVSEHAGQWRISVATEAADLHPINHHPRRDSGDEEGWVGLDRGLSAFVVAATADGTELARLAAPKPLAAQIARQRRLSKAVSRKQKGSRNRADAVARLARHHNKTANVRRHFLHQVTNALVKTHGRLVIEDLNVAGMLGNHHLARAISDVGWADFARLLRYKQSWRTGTVVIADRWFPSSKRCSACGTVNPGLALADRTFACACGFRADRDLNAAINLARWPTTQQNLSRSPDLPAGGRVINARRRDGADRHPLGAGETSPVDAGTDAHPVPV
ncbi:transposase [Nocardia sp. NBC_01503]|uniref:RNA-guided endonuclease InsQ/TnpB family protein n=1 Tax=Nocardia sp. NBC_01503 TaxID=2975997 RepID=UPI002E7B97AB|nr:RNA-guided endonuclease TnpB family protein [Nocardia sp. NBC_01503]WTL30923.1 transposase [Nocardia sp. NBC_01503]